MKKRLRGVVVFLRKCQHPEGISGRTGKFTIAVVVDDLLEIYVRGPALTQQTIAFAQTKISVRPSGATGTTMDILRLSRIGQLAQLLPEMALADSGWALSHGLSGGAW